MSPDGSEPESIRRKPRKGTRSCWECKRRKVRCQYASPNDAVCTGCTRRCLKCVSQDFPEQRTTSTARSRLVGDRIGRVEAMVRQLVTQAASGSTSPGTPLTQPGHDVHDHQDIPTPAESDTDPSPSTTIAPSTVPSSSTAAPSTTAPSTVAPSYSPSMVSNSPCIRYT